MKLNFLWHMHQPDYRDASGIMQMPWVFLHAIKDYYDMPWMVAQVDGIKATFNITPPLITQLELYYEHSHTKDKFLSLWYANPTQLQEDDRNWLIKICKTPQYERMINPLPRFVQLHAMEHYNNAELIELEVLFMLAWCGTYLKTQNPTIKALIQKTSGFTQEDKIVLLLELEQFVSKIFAYYKELHVKGIVALATTPLNHPILPLLLDMNNAIAANPSTNIPTQHICLRDDALMQVQKAQELFVEKFGFKARGFWPAEGAVDVKSAEIFRSSNLEWIATDEAILLKSLHVNDKNHIYVPYDFNGLKIYFRDHYLSDLIGFEYRYKNEQTAADDFVSRLQRIQDTNPQALVSVILDGENAWEFYEQNAYKFFMALYTSLQKLSWCELITMDEALSLPATKLDTLASGSWIHGEFNTWVGHKEKTRAWELLFVAKKDYEYHKNDLDEKTIQQITHHFLAAECSDWFWWYGDDHFSDFSTEFDALFRSHLIDIYLLMQVTPPADFFIPIAKNKSVQNFWIQPQSDISPRIDGKRDSFFEWIGCGVVDESRIFSTMDKVRGPVKRILYGQDAQKIYFAFEPDGGDQCFASAINIFIEPEQIQGTIYLDKQDIRVDNLTIHTTCKECLEFSIEKTKLDSSEISIRFEVLKNGQIIQTLPGFGILKITLNDDYSHNWFV
ncbi:MAG: glycoside hydrolase [Sulfurospirillum sp.]|nr:glycoside hydrolase [Sulfurospirillum sp.]